MKKIEEWLIYADDEDDDDDENVSVISSAWCKNRSGICLSFAININAMSITEIKSYGDEFIAAVKRSYKHLINDHFYAKTDTPVVSCTVKGEIIMMWSFQGDNDDSTVNALKSARIKEIKYT